MYRSAIMNAVRVLSLGVPVYLAAAAAAAQTPRAPDVATMSLEDLLGVEVVSTASKFPQAVKEAPASITVITADEIRRYGHRTLADTLRSVRGFYTSYDRNYSYLGMRGFARPGDYNTRILLLLDGHRLNDGIYDMAPIGTDFPIDVSLIERIEIIRGPGSSLYGTSAFFAVINVVTRTGASRKGLQVETQAGSLKTRGVSVSVGRLFSNGREFLVGGSTYRSPGQANLHFPEFDTNGPGSGTAIDLDDDESSNVFGTLSSGHFSIHGGVAHRRKQIPTASYGTVFGDNRESTVDDRVFLNVVYDGPVGRRWSGTARLAYDYYAYRGDYPYDYGEDGIGLSVDDSDVHAITGELAARRRFARVHLFTAGVEVRDQIRNHQSARDIYGEVLNVNAPGTNVGFYAQDEVRIFPWLLGNFGFRVDRFSAFGFHATPRAGLVLLPREQTAIKLLYGRAFRAPNAYELYYFNAALEGQFPLGPEEIRSTEIVWEESLSKHIRTAVTAFGYDAEQIITQRRAEGSALNEIYFANVGDIHGIGIEAEVETKLSNGISARVSQTFARVQDQITSAAVSNSPRHLSKLGVQIPVSRLFLSVEGQYVGERLTLGGETLDGFFTPNITLISPPERRLGFTLSIYNAFNHTYSDPGAEEHVQQSIRQDGRTVLARMRVVF
jgi:outer membrane receptor for ferrienterochelin and colicins